MADLGHLASPSATHLRWVSLLEEEFFRQGDRERSLGLSISPLMDRAAGGITLSQPGFFTVVAMPLYNALATYFPGCGPLVAAVRDNLAMWVVREEARKAQGEEGAGAAVPGAGAVVGAEREEAASGAAAVLGQEAVGSRQEEAAGASAAGPGPEAPGAAGPVGTLPDLEPGETGGVGEAAAPK